MNKNISVILTLYKTPIEKICNLNFYKNFPLIIFENEGSLYSKKKLGKSLKETLSIFIQKKILDLVRLQIYY